MSSTSSPHVPSDEVAQLSRARRRRDEGVEKVQIAPGGRTAQRGEGRRRDVGRARRRPGPGKDGAGATTGTPRWDRLGADERRSWSAQIAAREAHGQGLAALASPAQHRAVAAVLARACATSPVDVPAGEPS